MKTIVAIFVCAVLCSSCVAGQTIIVADTQSPPVRPAIDHRLGLFNDSNRWLKIEGLLGFKTLVLGPQKETVVIFRRYGESFPLVHAYERMEMSKDGNPRLKGFITTRDFRIRLDGRTRYFRGSHYGGVLVFSDGQFRFQRNSRRFQSKWRFGPATLDLFKR